MSHETSQVAIQDRPLLSIDAQPRIGRWTEIGEVEVIQTVFGNAKVRAVRRRDQTRRQAWLLTALATVIIGAAAWQSWLASEQVEPQQTAVLPPPVSANVQVIAPAPQPETVAPPAMLPSVESKPTIGKESASSRSDVLPGDEPVAAKPAKERPPKASKPQTIPLAADNAPMNQAAQPPLPKQAAPKQPSMAATVAMPPAAKPIAQPATSSTAVVAPLAVSPVKGDTSLQPPAGALQPPVSINPQPK